MGGLFSSPKIPAPTPPPRMPVPDDQAALEAKRRKAEELRMNQGRQSTDLSGGGTSLGK